MKSVNGIESEWGDCPSGVLAGFAESIRLRHRRRQLQRVGALAGVAVLVLCVVGLTIQYLPREREFGNLSCSEVQRLLPDYRAGRLDRATAQRVRQHLAVCEKCRAAAQLTKYSPKNKLYICVLSTATRSGNRGGEVW